MYYLDSKCNIYNQANALVEEYTQNCMKTCKYWSLHFTKVSEKI